ncbi:hypothetical protein [Pantoea ananatis]|uniref:hypothetical protein n=1 Tax=Pantoea ananas TaxID=553 RepID=UPI0021E7A443|nr:hypothetical protein [Pantoea ananatis]MCW0309731.1 hypothetical protein [Pantoea ananatis]MCW0341494.1 hypothetical protein [Pantoea ananatis]MCW0359971.1 hypothetical protein [Pantoea ananatis]MCW0364602.1 hypothetical protein [Pantoea ananatis]MCW1777079.1 hypothetical protein [Pantoea ananatis]
MLKNTPSAVVKPTVVASPESLKIADLDDLADYALHPVPWETTDVTCSAAAAVVTFARCRGLDSENDLAETAITDLLANLMHLCSAKDLPFCELLIRAGEHFRDEAAG